MWAAEEGYPEIVSLLVEAGTDVDLKGANGQSALAVATEAGQTEIAEILRIEGAATLISNIEQVDRTYPNRGAVDSDVYRAQGFTTGDSTSGHTITAVEIGVNEVDPGTVIPVVGLYDGDSGPGSLLHRLTLYRAPTEGTSTFRAPANIGCKHRILRLYFRFSRNSYYSPN